ncbi:DJ-1/PfpI family protein [Photobacterium swingsii]|uniref:DJ-1/PfpI family protein n=1 Tax=Photobacterium swingsii TaxID=680026 RepID=UPI004067C618
MKDEHWVLVGLFRRIVPIGTFDDSCFFLLLDGFVKIEVTNINEVFNMKDLICGRRRFIKRSVIGALGVGLFNNTLISEVKADELALAKPIRDRVNNSGKLNVGIYLYPNMTMLDAYAPLQVLALQPSMNTFTFSKEKVALPCDAKIQLLPDYGFSDCPEIDILIVPGAANPSEQMEDSDVISFLKKAGEKAKYITSVCTGSLILAETGLLDGYKTTTHWAYAEALNAYPKVSFVDERVVIDRNRVSGGGITSGLDFAFSLIAEVVGEEQAKAAELLLEYNPQPLFNSGDHHTADPILKNNIQNKIYGLASDLFNR